MVLIQFCHAIFKVVKVCETHVAFSLFLWHVCLAVLLGGDWLCFNETLAGSSLLVLTLTMCILTIVCHISCSIFWRDEIALNFKFCLFSS